MNSDPCPTGCVRSRRAGHLMCSPCWAEVPRHLQRDVLRTCRTWRRDPAAAEAFRAYRAASEAAVAAVA
jgi:hypothetical protein